MVDNIMNITGKKKCCVPHSPFLMRIAHTSNMDSVILQVTNQVLMDQKMARQLPEKQATFEKYYDTMVMKDKMDLNYCSFHF